MKSKRNFKEFLEGLDLLSRIQNYFNREEFFRIISIDKINFGVCLDILGTPTWFYEKDFLEGKLCR